MAAPIPIVVYVAPSGARAGSAGVFITLASDVAVMAPSTNIGAAHPVDVGGQRPQKDSWQEAVRMLRHKLSKDDESKEDNEEELLPPSDVMTDKVTNDTVAWVRSIAQARNRNMDWAERSVRESISSSSEEALEANVIDFVAPGLTNLLSQLNGRAISRLEGRVLNTQNAQIRAHPLTGRQRLLLVLTNPNVAYLLMMFGFYGLLFEITHPGIGFPGIAGLISLILALFAFQTLPTNYAGIALIALAVLLFIAETQVTSFGLLTLGGLVSMFLGSLMLIDSPYDFMQVSIWVILPMIVTTALITVALLTLVVRAHRRKAVTGRAGLLGEQAVARETFGPGKGRVDLHGEIWNAVTSEKIQKGETVEVTEVDHLTVTVKKLNINV